jgi:predicted RNase H-like HicB family nuclease
MQKYFSAIIEREGSGYVSLCPELDIASQGDTIEAARENQERLHEEVYVTQVAIAVG